MHSHYRHGLKVLSPYVLLAPGEDRRSISLSSRRTIWVRAVSSVGGIMQKVLYIGLDVHKATISVTAAEEGREWCGALHRYDCERAR